MISCKITRFSSKYRTISLVVLIIDIVLSEPGPNPGLFGGLIPDLFQIPILGPILPIIPGTAAIQTPLLGNVLNTATGLLGLANSKPADLLKLNLTLSPLDLETSNSFVCPAPLGIFADPDDCASFFVCALGIVELKLSCAPGFHYEPGLLVLCLRNNPISLPERCNRCKAYKTPRNCSSSPYSCSFCLQEGFDNSTTGSTSNSRSRCDSYANLKVAGCNETEIYNKTTNLGNRTIDAYDNSINPIHINLLPGDKKNISITFKLTSHPLDVYLLMDISGSMYDDKASVVALSSRLTTVIANLTKDYTLGFGAFSDKVDTYTYRNILRLSNDTSNFSNTVESTQMLNGGDFPEDAGTAMYECAICESAIGWRTVTRKLLFVLTDATFHTARDGSWTSINMGGEPFDGTRCQLDSSGIYTERTTRDYPSIQQLVDIFAQTNIAVLFGIVDGKEFYENFAKKLHSAQIGVLSRDSSNIIDLFEKEYRKIASRIEMKNSNATKEIQIKYYSNCNGNGTKSTGESSSSSSSGGTETETALCEGLPLDGQVTFTVEVGLKECPEDPADWKQTIKIYAAGLPHALDVPVNLICGSLGA